MPRDQNTQKPRGFAFLMYADQRSTVLAVDNLGGAKVLDRTLKVDHVLNYKQLERDNDTGKMKERETQRSVKIRIRDSKRESGPADVCPACLSAYSLAAHPDKFRQVQAADKDDEGGDDSDSSHGSIDPDDPMRDYLIEQKRAARKAAGGGDSKKRKHDGDSKEERRARKQERQRLREERAKRKQIKGAGAGSTVDPHRLKIEDKEQDKRRDDRDRSRSPGSSRRRNDSGRDRHDDRRRDDGEASRDRYRDRERERERTQDRDRRDDRRDENRGSRRDGDDRRRPTGGASAFADLEKWATGR